MSNRNPMDDYVQVKDRLPIFWERHPDGRVVTHLEKMNDGVVVFSARLYRGPDDPTPCATGWAFEREGDGFVNKTSHLENAETSAIGRALANLDIRGPDGDHPRPSREEMQKARRDGSGPHDRPRAETESGDEAEPEPSATFPEIKVLKRQIWEKLGSYITDPEMRKRYLAAYAESQVALDDDPSEWDALQARQALDDLTERGMAALQDLEPSPVSEEQGELIDA